MKAIISWLGNALMQGESGSGHSVIVDGPESIGGQNQGMRPMELMLMSVGACSTVDVISILKKARQDVKDCIVDLEHRNNAYIVYKLFDAMIAHTKEHGGNHWRADSVRVKTDSNKYGKLLKRRYNAQIYASTRGIIGE